MNYRPDIVVTDPQGKAVAWIEVKATAGDTFEQAEFYGLITSKSAPADFQFFVLITLSEISIWVQKQSQKIKEMFGTTLPSHSAQLPKQLKEALPRYLSDRTSGRPMHGEVLTRIVFQWMIHLRAFGADEGDTAEKMLKDAGFVDALRDAHLEIEQAA